MTKFYIKSLTALIIVFASITSNSQCVVCVDAPALITCGETATLTGDGFLTSSYGDDFNSGIGALWNSVSTGGTTTSTCTGASSVSTINCAGAGSVPAGDFLWFPGGSTVPRQATTIPIPVPAGGDIIFEFKMEGQGGSCDGPDLIGEGTMLQYRVAAGIWQDMPATMWPFNLNPMPYTNKAYFCPTNPQLQSFTNWNQYSIPIPAAAFSASTEFRWRQISPTSQNWDFWGLDNVNISTTSPGGATYTWNPGGAGQTLNVSPTSLTNYTFTYANNGISCSTTVVVDVAPPIVNPVIVPNPLNPCPNAIDLNADVSFNSCNYNIYLYDNGGDGWTTVPQTSTSIDNRIEVYVDGILVNTVTMNNGYGPFVYSFPVTSGGTFETVFLTGGPNPSECAYFVTDNQGQLITDAGGNIISAMGLITSPTVPVGLWPVPAGTLPSGGFVIVPADFGPVSTVCPTTNPYTYSWSISPGGSTAGISTPNSQSTVVTTASTQNYQVVATDVNNPGCIATGLVNVIGSGGSWDFDPIAPNPACEGDCIDLNFTSTVGSGNYNIVVEMIDATGSNSYTFTINSAGNNIATPGLPIELCPTISAAIPNVSFNILSLVDASDPNNCEIPITNASQVVTFATQPNAGTALINPTTYCESDAIVDLSTLISANPDLGGTWTYTGAGPAPANMPFVGLNYNFDPSSSPAGNYIYTVSNSPCLDDNVTLIINLETPPYAGQLPIPPTDMCMGTNLDLNASFLNLPVPFTPVWTDITSGTPGTNITNSFNPTAAGTYTFRNTISSTTNCPSDDEDITVIVHDLPTISVSSINQICLGMSIDLIFVVTGTANYIVTISDGVTPPFNVTLDGNGNDNGTGNPVSVTPGNIGLITYTIQSISDVYCSISVSNQSTTINVLSPPNSGTIITPLNVCSNDLAIFDLANQLNGQDLTGYWIDAGGFPQPPNSSFNFNSSMASGIYTYTVTSAVCPDATTNLPVTVITAPNTGTANPQSICFNDYGVGNLYNLNNLLSGAFDPGTWYDGATPIPTNINPATYGIGTTTFTYQVNGIPPCANQSINVDLTINPEPIVNTFTSSAPSTTQGYTIDIIVDMLVGSAPYTIGIDDDDSPINSSSIFIASGTSGQVTVSPNVIPLTTYSIVNITDGNGCTTTYNGTVPVGVIPYPIVNPFSTVTPEICEGDVATIEFDLTQGVVPVTIDYVLNGTTYTEILNSTGITSIVVPNANLTLGINTFSISSIVDVNGEASPNIPNDIQVVVNPVPNVSFTTTTPIICFGDDAILEFDFMAGTAAFTVNYRINGTPVAPPLSFPFMGTQTQILSPDPTVGLNTYSIINIIDSKGCIGNIANTVDILVQELPNINVTISGTNPICFGEISDLSFPILGGLAPFNLSLLEGATSNTLNIDASGLIGGQPYQVSPPNTTTYTLTSVTDANGCTATLTDNKTLVVNQLPVANISGTTEICFEEITQLDFNFTSGQSPWSLTYDINGTPSGPLTLSNATDLLTVSPATTSVYTFSSISDANNCSSTITDAITITVNQLPEVTVSGGGEVCDDGSTVDVIFNTTNGTPTFNLNYAVGISNRLASNIGYQYVLTTNESGTYSVTSVVDSKGCVGKSISGTADVIVNPMPVVKFSVYPQPADVTNPVITFVDQSTGHSFGTWDFDDNTIVSTNFGSLTHRFSDQYSGTYFVELYVETDKGCNSTIVQEIVIDNAFILYIPDAFSPNRDQINDIFTPIISGTSEYQLYIYSREGQKIFETQDPGEGWDGKVDNGDEYALVGKYAYAIYIVDIHGKKRNFQGDFFLIR
ncbi:MAG: hypothetical protein HN677_02950 [Flavobacteriales bacterium]|nr:hypothetical protein [Flavobacteriales bacterium]